MEEKNKTTLRPSHALLCKNTHKERREEKRKRLYWPEKKRMLLPLFSPPPLPENEAIPLYFLLFLVADKHRVGKGGSQSPFLGTEDELEASMVNLLLL